jgi:hypothetical protein
LKPRLQERCPHFGKLSGHLRGLGADFNPRTIRVLFL